jgi:hypothetical protein
MKQVKPRYVKTKDIHQLYFTFCEREGLTATDYETVKKWERVKQNIVSKYLITNTPKEFKEKALQYSENHGIIDFVVNNNTMIYHEKTNYGNDCRVYECKLNLETMEETRRVSMLEVQDIFNPSKRWVIKHSKCGHYYMNQKICSRMFYTRFTRTTRRYLKQLHLL